MDEVEMDAAIAARMADLRLFARGCGWDAIQATAKLRVLEAMTPEQRRDAYRLAMAAGKTALRSEG